MLKFKDFLREDSPKTLYEEVLLEMAAATKETDSDDKGKMHELLLAKYLHPESRLPDHHRSFSDNEEHAGTPDQVHDRLKEKVGMKAYNEIDSHAKQTAGAIKKHFQDQGHLSEGDHISNVFWTSNADKENTAGDHEKTVGVKDVNSNADLIARITDKNGKQKHVGISAKYGSQEPNFRNPGLDSLEKMAGLKSGTLNSHSEAHKTQMDKLGYNGSADNRNYQTKVDEMAAKSGIDAIRAEHAKHQGVIDGGKKLSAKNKLMHQNAAAFIQSHDALPEKERASFVTQAASRAAQARASNLESRKSMIKDFHQALSKKTPAELSSLIKGAVSPDTHIPHIVAHSKVKDDGSADSHVKPMHSLADEHFSQFDMSTLSPHLGAGTSVAFKAKHARTGKMMNVARINIKSSSGAHKNAVGSLKLKD